MGKVQPAGVLWGPQAAGIAAVVEAWKRGVQSVCLHAPTGGGKTRVAAELASLSEARGLRTAFFANRVLLIGQTHQKFAERGIAAGVRAATRPDLYDELALVQVVSADTEWSRAYQRSEWKRCPAELVVVDEAHIQKGETMQAMLDHYRAEGSKIVLLTATPIGLSSVADELVVSGTLAEYRRCKAIVPCAVRSICEPDMRKVKRNLTGEYQLEDRVKRVYTQTIVGHVLDSWKQFNPDARPTLLFAPGVPESVWLTEQFVKKLGVNWCHVDASECVVDGHRESLTPKLWEEISQRFRDGNIVGISSRFKLREGIDFPFAAHAILATPIGSLASYLQTIGRIMRWSPETPDMVTITDHGGNYHRHGSPNHDRAWGDWWTLPEHVVSKIHEQSIRDGRIPEPIVCPQCKLERTTGIKCPGCGFTHEKSKRHVVFANGTIRCYEGKMIRPRLVRKRANTQELWTGLFWGWRKSKKESMATKTFTQLEAWFFRKHHYYPPRTLDWMPMNSLDFSRRVQDVPLESLRKPGAMPDGVLAQREFTEFDPAEGSEGV